MFTKSDHPGQSIHDKASAARADAVGHSKSGPGHETHMKAASKRDSAMQKSPDCPTDTDADGN